MHVPLTLRRPIRWLGSAATVLLALSCSTTQRSFPGGPGGAGGDGGSGGTGGSGGAGACQGGAMGDEGCPCASVDECDAGLTCENGTCTDPFPDCDNGLIDPGEECDDGNKAAGDGCAPDCRFEPLCLVAHLGGDPARVASIQVSRDGGLAQVGEVTLGGVHKPDTFANRRRGIAWCGSFAYAALEQTGAIAALGVGPDGSLSPTADVTSQPGVFALLCDEEAKLLFGFSLSNVITAYSYAVGADGALTPVDQEALIYPLGNIEFEGVVLDPTRPQLYVAAGGMTGMLGYNTAMSRLSYAPDGAMQIEQHPVDAAQDLFLGMGISPNAKRIAFPGYSGGCFAYHDLGPGGEIPDKSALTVLCSPFGNGHEIAMREDDVFYYSHSDTTLRVAEFIVGGATTHATYIAAGGRNHLLLAYGQSLLVAASDATGDVSSYVIGADAITLTLAATFTTGEASGSYQSSVLVPCPN